MNSRKKDSGPKPLSALFERYKQTLKAPEQVVIREVVMVIDELLDISIAENQIAYTPATRTICIKHGMLKSEILPHKKELLTHLTGRLGVQSAPTEII